MTSWAHTGVVLAGGALRRMGRCKPTLTLPDGRRLIDAVAETLASVCTNVVVAGGAPDLAPDLRHVADRRAGEGPLAGIEAVLDCGLDDEYLVCPCDLPRLTIEPLLALADAAGRAALAVLHVAGEDRPHPLPARITTVALPAVRELLDTHRRAVRGLFDVVETVTVPAPAAWSTLLTNVNTPEDWGTVTGST